MLIGLTGTYCAGKNHVAALLELRGLPVLDVDKLGYQVLENEKQTIFASFGKDLQKADGSLDRRLLGQRVFGNPEKLAALENIVHPQVNRLTEDWISQQTVSQQTAVKNTAKGDRACVINAALLHRSVVFNRLKHIILVRAPFFTRFLRARRRDKISWREILKRFASQKDFNSKYLTLNAEIYIVENPGLLWKGWNNSDAVPAMSDGGCFSINLHQKLEYRIDKILERIK